MCGLGVDTPWHSKFFRNNVLSLATSSSPLEMTRSTCWVPISESSLSFLIRLNKLLGDVVISQGGVVPFINPELLPSKTGCVYPPSELYTNLISVTAKERRRAPAKRYRWPVLFLFSYWFDIFLSSAFSVLRNLGVLSVIHEHLTSQDRLSHP